EMQMLYHQENADVVARIVQRWRKTRFLSDKDQRRLTCALQNMRMSCNSTYLLDQETDHGVKADELAALFEDLFAEPEAKAVVFSQWTRTHDIVIRRLEKRELGYVSFHGGVPSDKRPALVERFRDDRACRVFLSTDAGSTGLNLQHASTLVNMDLPWNPAILEQRIARIHRMGQKQPVRVINFVAKGTIEEGMLSVLAFKRSLSAGILDGGSSEISLGGSRLNRFMKDVENVTGRMGEGEAVTPAEEVRNIGAAAVAGSVEDVNADVNDGAGETAIARADGAEASSGDAGSDPWQALVQVGTQFLAALAAAHDPSAPAHPWIERDPASGTLNLKIPLPPAETARQLANALSALADSLRGR
ncbi:MAG: helicase-related protein, partial [Stellaceae bacterium]